ncbi:MAG: hypothetical protein JWN15_2567 [Firmicutes bacterium]|nr:hypothetical protein [Bacillota bacterium]
MVRGRRYLVLREIAASVAAEFAADQERRYAACPEAAQYPDEEAEDFLQAAHYMDYVDHKQIVSNLQAARISFPIELTYDEYRLGRYILRRWRDPILRQAFLQRALTLDFRGIRKLRGPEGVTALLPSVDWYGAPQVISALRHHGLGDTVPAVMAALSPAQASRYRALLLFGKVLMHEFITQPEPPRQPSPWEQQKLARRIRLRDVQLHAMTRSSHALRRERQSLLRRVRAARRQQHPELDGLASELAKLRAAHTEAARLHAAALAEQACVHREAADRLHAELAAALHDYQRTLTVRTAWSAAERRQ